MSSLIPFKWIVTKTNGLACLFSLVIYLGLSLGILFIGGMFNWNPSPGTKTARAIAYEQLSNLNIYAFFTAVALTLVLGLIFCGGLVFSKNYIHLIHGCVVVNSIYFVFQIYYVFHILRFFF